MTDRERAIALFALIDATSDLLWRGEFRDLEDTIVDLLVEWLRRAPRRLTPDAIEHGQQMARHLLGLATEHARRFETVATPVAEAPPC